MDAATKLQADREYVDRFFHGVASKLMTHPYFSKFANQTNIAAEVPASAASLGRVLAAVAENKEVAAKVAANAKQLAAASAEQTVVRTKVSLDQYEANMKLVRELFGKRSELLQKLKTDPKDLNTSKEIQYIDRSIMAIYVNKADLGSQIIQTTPGLNQASEKPFPRAKSHFNGIEAGPLITNLHNLQKGSRLDQQSLPEKHVANVQSALARIADILTQKANELQQDLNDNPQRKDADAIKHQMAAYKDAAKNVVVVSPQQTKLIELVRPDRPDRVGRPELTDEELKEIIAQQDLASQFSPGSTTKRPEGFDRLAGKGNSQDTEQVQPSDLSLSAWTQPELPSGGGRIQRKRTVKKGSKTSKINKNKRPQ